MAASWSCFKLVPRDGVFLDVSNQAPAPSKDFNQFIINSKEVIWRTWKITLRNDYRRVAPGELRESHEDFTYDDCMQFDVGRVFGEATLEYAKELCKGNLDYIVRMPRPLLIYLVSFLELEDVAALSQTCKLMHDICNTDALWEQIYETHCDTVTDEMRSLAHEMGWKRMFFTNKLQLQVKLRRHQNKQSDATSKGTTFVTDP